MCSYFANVLAKFIYILENIIFIIVVEVFCMLRNIKEGDRIGEKFIILEKIGGDESDSNKTSFGVVYIALNIVEDIIVALKTFQDKFINHEDILDDFKIESLECVKLNYHPNVVFSCGVEKIDGRHFLVMEPILTNEDGRRTLKDYFSTDLSLEQILDWSIQICHGMEFINNEGIKSYGDIKPENILINYLNKVKISDFGFLELFDQKQEQIKGTPAYMAPESFKCINNVKTDIYSFGIVLYQLANDGKLPFSSETNFFEDWEEIHKTHDVPLTYKNEKLNLIICKCLDLLTNSSK